MGTIPHVLHRAAKPISVTEFADALRATCPPRFPWSKTSHHQVVGIAVSGGVDSMALAYLCSRLRQRDPFFRVGDSFVGRFMAMTVDHGLREGSDQETLAVLRLLKEKIGLKIAPPLTLRWKDEFGLGVHPKNLPNFESMARRLRYRALGTMLGLRNVDSLLLAHHEDDQYETLLMRLVNGHGPRGLRGMRRAADIPECQNLHGVYRSGFLDDQKQEHPMYNIRPNRSERKNLKRIFRYEMDLDKLDWVLDRDDDFGYFTAETEGLSKRSREPPALAPLDIEDAGVMIYRPLLEFSKDRLVATCLENNIPWFEDHTNHDPTLTMRNAVRHMVNNYELPRALQKPAVLQMSRNCDARITAQEQEAERLASELHIQNFSTNAGTLLVQFPPLPVRKPRRRHSLFAGIRRRLWVEHDRGVAALLVRKVLDFVSPEQEMTPTANLQLTVDRLFPSLARSTKALQLSDPPKAFNISGVHFVPVQPEAGGHLSWFLSREPYPGHVPVPTEFADGLGFKWRWRRYDGDWPWASWPQFRLYDGRYWFRIRTRLPAGVVVAPFSPEHAKPFREALADPKAREDLAALLKRHAPGKVRYTLPAVYAVGDVEWALNGRIYWPREYWSRMEPLGSTRGKMAIMDGSEGGQEAQVLGLPSDPEGLAEFHSEMEWDKRTTAEAKAQARENRGRLLALPTLGVHIPGIEDWLQWEFRYRKVDSELLERRLLKVSGGIKGWNGRRDRRPESRRVTSPRQGGTMLGRGNRRKWRRTRRRRRRRRRRREKTSTW